MTKSAVAFKRLAVENRRGERMSVMRPVRLGGRTGATRNISTLGVFFETDVDYAPGSEIIFAIELVGPPEKNLILQCRGKIVRIEHRAAKVGVAVEIVASQARVSMCDEVALING
jgi:hypothetical protein